MGLGGLGFGLGGLGGLYGYGSGYGGLGYGGFYGGKLSVSINYGLPPYTFEMLDATVRLTIFNSCSFRCRSRWTGLGRPWGFLWDEGADSDEPDRPTDRVPAMGRWFQLYSSPYHFILG